MFPFKLKINEIEGIIWTILIVLGLYVYPYYLFVRGNLFALELTLLFFFSILLAYLKIIRAGTRRRLAFFERDLDTYWENGIWLVPSLLPISHHIGLHLLWHIIEEDEDNPNKNSDQKIHIDHHYDQRQATSRINVETSLIKMALYNLFGSFMDRAINIGDDELRFKRLSFKLAIILILAGYIANVFFPNSPKKEIDENGEINIIVRRQLGEDNFIGHFPPNSFFTIMKDEKIVHPIIFYNKRLIPFNKNSEFGIALGRVDVPDLCYLIPAGEKLGFSSPTPPVYVANIERKVEYYQPYIYSNIFEKIYMKIYDMEALGYRTSSTWKKLSAEWRIVINSIVYAKALDPDEIPDKVAGGMICF